MAAVVVTSGNSPGWRVPLTSKELIIGRSPGLPLTLQGTNISRRHARIIEKEGRHFIEDLGSSNGTFLNDRRLNAPTPLSPRDLIRVGSYSLLYDSELSSQALLTIEAQTLAAADNQELYRTNPAQTLQAVLELAHHLANTLEIEPLLERFLDQVVKLFPKADRAVVFSLECDEPAVRLVRNICPFPEPGRLFSETVLRQIKDKGIAVLAHTAAGAEAEVSLGAMGVHSLVCVPLRVPGSPVFGAVQLERFHAGAGFTNEDLYLLTAIALQVSLVLEKARLHEQVLNRERMAQEIALAREIQFAFLPNVPLLPEGNLKGLGAEIYPATEVSGDFYDFIVLDSSRVALVVADVSGKGMPAALFMAMVRALLRHIAQAGEGAAEILMRLNDALTRDNPKFMFVTLLLGIYKPLSGECVVVRAGHPAPLLKKLDGSVLEIDASPGCLLGIEAPCPALKEKTILLKPGESLLFYTDGITEAAKLESGELFGTDRLKTSFERFASAASLKELMTAIRADVQTFCAPSDPQDDITLLVLRHESDRPELNIAKSFGK